MSKASEWHIVKELDRERIHCQSVYAGAACNQNAVACHHTAGGSFFYYCETHAKERGFAGLGLRDYHQEADHGKAMSKARALLLAKLQAFVNAAVELEHAFGQLESDDDQLAVARDYPFDKSFEELLHDIFEWRDSVQAQYQPIRCTACGTQREHLEVQRMVTGHTDLVCCEMVLDRNLEANACPEPEDDPKVIAAFRAAAKREYHRDGATEIDENAKVSISEDGGAYVQAWVWVSNEEADVCACGEIITEEGGDGLCGSCADKADAEHTPVDENHEFSCAKCGTRTHVKDGVLDEGYLYCSEACKEAH